MGEDGGSTFVRGADAISGGDGGSCSYQAGAGDGAGLDGRHFFIGTTEFFSDVIIDENRTPVAESSVQRIWVDDGAGALVENALYSIDESGIISRLDTGRNLSSIFTSAPGPTLTPGAPAVPMSGLSAASPEEGSIAFTPGTALWTASRDGVFEFRISCIMSGVGAAESLELALVHSIAGTIAELAYPPLGAASQGFFALGVAHAMLAGETVQIQVQNTAGASVTPIGVTAVAKQIG